MEQKLKKHIIKTEKPVQLIIEDDNEIYENNNLTIVETFVGAGGAHLGFQKAGFKSLLVNDIDKDTIDTLLKNKVINDKEYLLCPIEDITEEVIKHLSENIKTKIRVKGRDLFPSKSFSTGSFEYDQSKYLPTSSYYQIEDYRTNEIIIPFGEYSKLSCDSKSNYFYLDTATYPINRVYKLKLKVVKDGVTKIIDDKLTFEII